MITIHHMKWIKKENYWNSLINAREAFEHKRNKEEKDAADMTMKSSGQLFP